MNETTSHGTNCRNMPHTHEHRLAQTISEVRDEVKAFITTRLEMIKAELNETLGAVKVGLPLALLAIGLFSIAALLFTGAVVVLVASAFAGSTYAWFFAFVIVGALWSIFATVAGYFAYTQFRGGFPKRTIEVIKADKAWLQSEVRTVGV